MRVKITSIPPLMEGYLASVSNQLDPTTWPKLITILRTYILNLTNTLYEDVDYGDVLPPTTFVHAGFEPQFVLLILRRNVNWYIHKSPSPKREDQAKPQPTYTLQANHVYIVSECDVPAFVLESEDEHRAPYILLRKHK